MTALQRLSGFFKKIHQWRAPLQNFYLSLAEFGQVEGSDLLGFLDLLLVTTDLVLQLVNQALKLETGSLTKKALFNITNWVIV